MDASEPTPQNGENVSEAQLQEQQVAREIVESQLEAQADRLQGIQVEGVALEDVEAELNRTRVYLKVLEDLTRQVREETD